MRLSYSSISTYETCPAKYRYQHVDRVPRRPSPFLAFGDSIHRALFLFHDRPVPVAPSLPELLALLDDQWVSEGFGSAEEERMYRDHAREVLARYHADNAGAYRIPAALEFRFTVEMEGVALSGVIDRMDRLPGGGYEIVDYKTNRRLPPRARVDSDLQLSLYAYAAREVWGIDPERLTLYYLLPGQRMTTTRGSEDLDALRRRVATVAGHIEAGRFEPRENPLCRWCDFRHLCPLFSPPMPPARVAEAVEEWIRLKREERGRGRRLEELGAVIRAYAEEHGQARLYGEDAAVQVVRRVDTSPDPAAARETVDLLLREGLPSRR